MKKFVCLFVAICMLLSCALAESDVSVGCPKAEVPQMTLEEYPVVDGSTATLPLSYALMQAVCGVSEDEAKITITHTKTTQSFYSLVADVADILLVYAPEASALEYAKEQGVELLIAPITRDALVFLVNDANPVQSLTHEEILGIYTGNITNWNEVGGDDAEIIAYQRVESSGSQVMMRAQVMKDVEMADAPTELRPSEMGELIDSVASYKNTANAIGYSVYYYAHNMYIQQDIRLLSVGDVAPSNETIASGEYPYCQDVYAVIRADAPEDSPQRILFDFLQTAAGGELIESAGYVRLETPET